MNASAIRKMVVTALVGHTDAGDRVYSPRDWPTSAALYPALLVQTRSTIKRRRDGIRQRSLR
jgi:hypothetical protein